MVVGSVVGYSAYVWLLARAPLSLATTYAYVNPAVAVVLGALFLAEPLTVNVLVGGAVIIAAVAFVITAESRGRRSPVPATGRVPRRSSRPEPVGTSYPPGRIWPVSVPTSSGCRPAWPAGSRWPPRASPSPGPTAGSAPGSCGG